MRTGNVEVDFKAILASTVASDARVVSAVGERRGVEDERTDSILVDDDLVQPVIEHLGAVTEPQQVGVRSSRHDTVEARHVALWHLNVCRNLAERRPEIRLRDAAQLAVMNTICRTAYNKKA